MTAHTRAGLVLSLLVSLLSATGCSDDLSEVVLVMQSDLGVPADVDSIDVTVASGPVAPLPSSLFFAPPVTPFPLSVGFVSQGETTSFSFVVRLFKGGTSSAPELVVSRTVSDVRFVMGQTLMLRVSLPRVCACDGTSCPLPGNPLCDNIRTPELEPFDPAVAPPSTMMPQPQQTFPVGPPRF